FCSKSSRVCFNGFSTTSSRLKNHSTKNIGGQTKKQKTNNNDQQQSESTPFLDNIRNLYQSVQNLDSDDVWNNSLCKQILLRPKNPCESLCLKLFMNIDDTVVLTPKLFVCDSCCKFTTFSNIDCTCGNSPNKEPRNLDIIMKQKE
ncbi:hypothetical protein RYX36_011907, partial [Vicia faba]